MNFETLFDNPIFIPEAIQRTLTDEQLDACFVLGLLDDDPLKHDIRSFQSYPQLASTLSTLLIDLKTQEEMHYEAGEETMTKAADIARCLIGAQSLVYFSSLLTTYYNEIFPPIIDASPKVNFEAYIHLYQTTYPQASRTRSLHLALSREEFLEILEMTNPAADIFGLNMIEAAKEVFLRPDLRTKYPHLAVCLHDHVDTFRLVTGDMAAPVKRMLEGMDQNELITNRKPFFALLDFILKYMRMFEQLPPLDIESHMKYRHKDLLDRFSHGQVNHKELIEQMSVQINSWEDFVYYAKEDLVATATQLAIPEILLEAFAGMEEESMGPQAQAFLSRFYEVYSYREGYKAIIWSLILSGLHRYGRSRDKTEEIITGIVRNVSVEDREVVIRLLSSMIIPPLILKGLALPQNLPQNVFVQPVEILASYTIANGDTEDYFEGVNTILSRHGLRNRVRFIAQAVSSELVTEEETDISDSLNEVLRWMLMYGNSRELVAEIYKSVMEEPNTFVSDIAKVLKDERFYPPKSVYFKAESYHPYDEVCDTWYEYISSLVVGCNYGDKKVAKDIKRIYKAVKRENADFAGVLKRVSAKQGIYV